MQTDLVLYIMPKIQPDAPTVGPAVLKTILKKHGYQCTIFDLNIDSYNAIIDKDIWNNKDYLFLAENYDDYLNNFANLKSIRKLYKHHIQRLVKLNPRYVGISLLTKYSYNTAFYFSTLVKNALPNTKIVWGGAGIYKSQCIKLVDEKIIDDFLLGDGEEQILELLNGTLDPDKNTRVPKQFEDLNSVPIPDYSDINWQDYKSNIRVLADENVSYITASRGCVRRCTFCDIASIWPKFKFRSAENIVEEITHIHQTYKRTHFKFTDSLINGSQSEFRKMLVLLAEYRKKYPQIVWSSQFIAKSKRQMPPEDFVLLKESGCKWLEIGFEHLVEKIRFDMNKKITDDDMWYTIEQCYKNDIHMSSLMITGWITETEEDHQQGIQVLKEMFNRGYSDKLTFSFGNILTIDQNSPLWDQYKNNKELVWEDGHHWEYKGNTLDVRLRRWEEIRDIYRKLNKRHNTKKILSSMSNRPNMVKKKNT